MRSDTWEYLPDPDGSVVFDWHRSFDEQVSVLKSSSGGAFRRGSHNYWVLRALFNGHTIDDYRNKIYFPDGMPVNNIRTRISDLRNNWNISIGSRISPNGNYKEYQIHGRDA